MEPSEDKPKLSNFKALCETLVRVRIVNPKENESKEEATASFLRKGKSLSLPVTVRISSKSGDPSEDQWMPYRAFPTPALESLNTAVRFLEYCLQRDNNPNQIEPDNRNNPYNNQDIRDGALQLATLLVPNCIISQDWEPQGKYSPEPGIEDAGRGKLLHRSNPKDPGKPILTKRAKILKGLLGRLEKHESIRIALQPTNEKEIAEETSPALQEIQRLQILVEQEIKSSLRAWKTLREEILEKKKSIEDLPFSESQEALKDDSESNILDDFDQYDTDPLDRDEEHADRQLESAYYDAPSTGSPEQEEKEKKIRKNLPCEPDGWIWRETTDPMDVITAYVSEEILPKIEEKKESLLATFQDPSKSDKEKQNLAPILPEKKYNPNDFWKMISLLAENTPEEDISVRQRLANARFAICLKETNIEKAIPHSKFLTEWEKTVSDHLLGKNPQASRNHALLNTLSHMEETKTWTPKEFNQWLEHLQTLAPGGYENSTSQEKNRDSILKTLNNMVGRIKHDLLNTEKEEDKIQLEKTMDEVAKGITLSLQGPSGQTVRRELRHHIKTLKDQAVERGEKPEAENFKQLWAWITSISSQIKEGTWFEPTFQTANQKVARALLIDILSQEQDPKETTFHKSPTPEGKNEVLLCTEFLKSISRDNATQGFAGRAALSKKIADALNQIQDSRQSNLGTKLSTKVWSKEKNIENLPNKIRSAQKIQDLLEQIPKESSPLETLFAECEKHFQRIVDGPKSDSEAEETLAFWDAMNLLSKNIRMRKEKPQFQASPLGQKMLNRCAQIAKEHYTGVQTVPQILKENMARNSRKIVLLSHAIAPLGLWIKSPKKGKNQIPHQEILESFQQRTKNLQEIHKLFENNQEGNLEKQVKQETTIAIALNIDVLDRTQGFLQNPTLLSHSLTWQHRNQPQVKILTEKFPTKDTPQERLNLVPEKQKNKETPLKLPQEIER